MESFVLSVLGIVSLVVGIAIAANPPCVLDSPYVSAFLIGGAVFLSGGAVAGAVDRVGAAILKRLPPGQ